MSFILSREDYQKHGYIYMWPYIYIIVYMYEFVNTYLFDMTYHYTHAAYYIEYSLFAHMHIYNVGAHLGQNL